MLHIFTYSEGSISIILHSIQYNNKGDNNNISDNNNNNSFVFWVFYM